MGNINGLDNYFIVKGLVKIYMDEKNKEFGDKDDLIKIEETYNKVQSNMVGEGNFKSIEIKVMEESFSKSTEIKVGE